MNNLTDVDADEVSPVRIAANRRRVVLKEGDVVNNEVADIMAVPWEREGALLDEIRKDGIHDEVVEEAVIAAVRLLKGVEGEFSPELVEKLGTELYGNKNPKLNTSKVNSIEDLDGKGSGGKNSGSASGPKKDGKGRDGELSGKASGKKVAADNWEDDDEDDVKKEALSPDEHTLLARLIQKAKGKVSKEDSSDIEDEFVTDYEGGGTVEVQVPVRKEDGTWDFSGVPSENRPFYEEMILKAETAEKDLTETREKLAKAEDNLAHRTMVEKAAAYSHVAPTDDLAPILKAASESMDEETFGKLEELLGAAEERITKGDLFTEQGKNALEDGAQASDAYSQIVQKAHELVEKSDSPLSEDQAISRAINENPGLYAKYLAETGMGVS